MNLNLDILAQIAKIMGRQITNISQQVIRAIKTAIKPFTHLNKYVREQVKSMIRRPASKEDYVRLFGVYVSKRFLGLGVMGLAGGITLFSTVAYPWMEGRFWIPSMPLNSVKMASYTGTAKIKNDMGVVIYHGDVVEGQLTGQGSQYDAKGSLVYVGEFLNAAYHGSGRIYSDGVLRYDGSFSNNLRDGKGKSYDEFGNLIYQGEYAQDLRNGRGMEYRVDTHTLSYFGDFVNDQKEGSGVAYEEDGTTVSYRGQFAAGLYEGQGSYYEQGKLVYQGFFSQGLFEGSGTLYDESGAIAYQGDFSKGNRQGAGTVYDNIGSALYTGEFLNNNINYMGYLGKTPEDLAASFGTPGYARQTGDCKVMSYLNLGTSFLCTDDGTGMMICDRILINETCGFLDITRETTREELEQKLGQRFSSVLWELTDAQMLGVEQMSLHIPKHVQADKYLMSTYYIKVYYDQSGEKPVLVECGSY